jgi:hypothetical protein
MKTARELRYINQCRARDVREVTDRVIDRLQDTIANATDELRATTDRVHEFENVLREVPLAIYRTQIPAVNEPI